MIELDKEIEAARLRGSLLEFTKFFFKYMTNRDYIESRPVSRESHQIIICRELTKLFRFEQYESNKIIINVPPGHGKTLHVCMFIAWAYAHYPDCNFLYLSYSHELSSKHTSFIKQLMSSQMYRYLFDVNIRHDSRAKDHFVTTGGGTCAAFGSSGSITGRDAGYPGSDRFTGAVIIDDPIKPDDAHSSAIRETVIKNYQETISQRVRDENVPIIYIGQRLHEDDLAAFLINDNDVWKWNKIILKSLDEANNALYPEVFSKEYLHKLQEKSPYVFSAQHQQQPVPAGGALFRKNWFVELDENPEMLKTFITADTAETTKTYNDATVFSFWGVYEIEVAQRKMGLLALHWIDCIEMRIEPKDLKNAFIDFWHDCCRAEMPPEVAAIEKKSTGVTLLSLLQDEARGIAVRAIERSRSSGSKTDRFVRMQSFIKEGRISISKNAVHKEMCLEHMSKITANNTHRFDDIADTLADAIDIALISKQIASIESKTYDKNLNVLRKGLARKQIARRASNATSI